MVSNLLFNALSIEFIGCQSANPRANLRGRNQVRIMGQRTHVQYLHDKLNVGICSVNSIGDQPMPFCLAVRIKLRCGKKRIPILIINRNTALFVWRNTACDDHANTTRSALGIKGRHALEAIGHLF